MDLNRDVESPCVRTPDWGFVGFVEDKKRKADRMEPIGVYATYQEGAKHADEWMRNTKGAMRWEGSPLYEPIREDDNA